MKRFAKLAILAATLIWGSSFFIMKNAVGEIPVAWLLGIRFTVAAITLAVIFAPHLKHINREYILQSSLIGLCIYIGYYMQTIGVERTTPGKNAFLTAVYVVVVPFLYWLVDKKKPTKLNVIAALLCVAGIGLVSLDGSLSINLGDIFTLIGGVMFAMHIVVVAKFGHDKDMIAVTVLQFAYAGVFAWITALLTEKTPDFQFSPGFWPQMAYLAFGATAAALLLQNLGQKYTPPAEASLLLSLEAVFGVIFSTIFYKEKVSFRVACGFVLIFTAIIVSEYLGSKLKGNKDSKNEILEVH